LTGDRSEADDARVTDRCASCGQAIGPGTPGFADRSRTTDRGLVCGQCGLALRDARRTRRLSDLEAARLLSPAGRGRMIDAAAWLGIHRPQ